MSRKKKTSTSKKLSHTYYNPKQPGAYGGVEALKRATKLKRSVVKNWLSTQDTYTLHKPVRHQFERRRVIVGGIDHQWQADLIDVKNLKKDNDGFVFLLTCVDVLSKYAWVVPLKNKTGNSLVEAFQRIFTQGRKPLKLQTDKGSEFRNRVFQRFLKEEGVESFVTENEDIKASVAERFNRTLKEKLWRYFTRKNTQRYVGALTHLVRSYNHSYHRSIKIAPADVSGQNQEEVWQTLYEQPVVLRTPRVKFSLGDRVRISKVRRVFKKGYLPSWTEELFTISRVNRTTPMTYVLKDDHGEELAGTFYPEEIQKVGEKQIYRIEKVLNQRTGRHGQRQYLVRWYGYSSLFDSWIPKNAFAQYSA